MNYKEIIDRSVSELDKAYPCSDHRTALSKVLERTDKMKDYSDGYEHRKLIEITPERAAPKKSSRIFRAVAGTAAAVALVGGSVLGIKFLAENGGLKERTSDTGTRPGYHETESPRIDPTNDGMFLTQSDKDLLEGNAYPAVDIPEGTRYDFNGFYVEPRWCTFDGMTLNLAYDVVYDGEQPADIENNVKIESEGGLISGYLLNRSDSRVVMKASVYYPGIVHSTKVDLVSEADGTRYTFTADIPEGVHLFSADLLGTDIPINDTGITKKLIHIDASSSGISLTFENKPEERGIAAQLEPKTIIKLTDGTEIRPTGIISAQDWYERQEGDKLYIRFITQSFDPSDIDEIRVNDVIIYLSSSPEERTTDISVSFNNVNEQREYEFLYYIDGELDKTDPVNISEEYRLVWKVSGTGQHVYKVVIRCPDTQSSGTLFECTVDFDKDEPTKDFGDSFNGKIFKYLSDTQKVENSEPLNNDRNDWEKYAIAVPEGTRYEFNGFAVEPRWCYFDGTTAHIAYDVVGEDPEKASVNISSDGAEITGYELNRSDGRIVLSAVLSYSEARNTAYIDFTDPADERKYTLTAIAPQRPEGPDMQQISAMLCA